MKNRLLLHSSLERSIHWKMLHLIPQIMNTFFMWSHNYTHFLLCIQINHTKNHKYLGRGCT